MHQPADGEGTEAAVVGEAYATARELLRRAEEDAARIRAEADRYVQQRHLEAELVVGKARRMLLIAEERVAAMDAGAVRLPPAAASVGPATIDLTQEPAVVEEVAPVPSGRGASALDSILAGAVTRAIARALPTDP